MNPIKIRRVELTVIGMVSLVMALMGVWVISKGFGFGWVICIPFFIVACLLFAKARRSDQVTQAEMQAVSQFVDKHPVTITIIVIIGVIGICLKLVDFFIKVIS